jgi:hypothetical protein
MIVQSGFSNGSSRPFAFRIRMLGGAAFGAEMVGPVFELGFLPGDF